MASVILVPGLWLDGSSWGRVVAPLVAAGHRAIALTLPGMSSKDAERTSLTLEDHVDAVVGAIDACPGDDALVVVGHSAGCGVVHGALDRRPARVSRAIHIGGFPTGDGLPVADGFAVDGGDIPLPGWSSFDDADIADMDDQRRAEFSARAIPSAAALTRDPQRLVDTRRYDVPVTMVATEYTTEMLRSWVQDRLPPVLELSKIAQVEYVDLHTGHWPQITQPEAVADVILDRLPSPS